MSRHAATIAARAGVDADAAHGAVMPPLYLSTNYSFAGFAQKRAYDYTRSGNPTRDVLAGALAELEGGVGGVITASGMAAITLLTAQLTPQDLLVPLSLLREYARRAGANCRLLEISSIYGHDAFLKEEAVVGTLLREALEAAA